MKVYPSIRIEGGIIAPDILDKIIRGELPGQKPRDFGLEGRKSLIEEIASVFAEAQSQWRSFQRRIEELPEDDLGTTITRNAWIIPFLSLLGYDLRFNKQAYKVDELTFAISHRAGESLDAPPVHIVGVKQDLGRRAPSGRPRLSPHALVQEYLNRSEALWGIVTNGKILRLLRDATYIRKQSYIEFDLEAIFDQRLFEDFAILFRLIHRTRLPRSVADAHESFLERYYQFSKEQGERIRDKLRYGVEKAIGRLANGFIKHPKNTAFRNKLISGDITVEYLYQELLRLIYRFLFLFVAEDRGLISQDPIYLEHYSVSRFRKFVDDRSYYTEHHDLWLSLRTLWKLLSDDTPVQQLDGKPLAASLGLYVLDGELFESLTLDELYITNRDLLEGLEPLINYRESEDSYPRKINYAALDVEELGSVYESLLDYRPRIILSDNGIKFELIFGSERKSTGSYYTPHELVEELIKSALEPVIRRKLDEACEGVVTDEEKKRKMEEAILSIKVLDPATGSGHFLLAAARRLAKELAKIRTGEDEPSPEARREAFRDVLAHSIYGVDKNPLAVELCKVALWIEGHVPGKPITFLDHRIKCGDSLVGVLDLKILQKGIPNGAFNPVSGDDRKMAQQFKRVNSRDIREPSLLESWVPGIRNIAQELQAFEDIQEKTASEVQTKAELYRELQKRVEPLRAACNMWTAAFFQSYQLENQQRIITTSTVRTFLTDANRVPEGVVSYANTLALKYRFFHWPLEFPEVFARGGFDVVLSNPPWERIKLQEKEFFSTRDPQIASAPNAAVRKRLIRQLPQTNLELWQTYQDALHTSESLSRFLRESGFYPLTGRGDINTYSVFTERMRSLLRPGGHVGTVVPTGIATDATNKHFFSDIVRNGELVSLFDFENREGLFPHVHRSYKFSLLTIQRPEPISQNRRGDTMSLAFFCTRVEHLKDPRRLFSLTLEDIVRINPNTRTLPVFRTRQDAELTRAIYHRVPVLVNELTGENPWDLRFLGMFHMSNDSHLFRTRDQLEAQGYRLVGNRFVKDHEVWLPLYEAKMIWHYDHRFGTYEGFYSRSNTHLPTPGAVEHMDPSYLVHPWYWVPAEEVEKRLGVWKREWLIGFRDVTNATNERTSIFSLLPRVGVGNNTPLMLVEYEDARLIAALLANFSTMIFDYPTRQKIAGVHMNFFFVQQLPVLPPTAYTAEDLRFIVPRVLELVYTAWDIKPFADDVWREADVTLKEAIRRQWEENAAITGGHTWNLPDWIEAYPEIETDPAKGIPFPPFKWDEERRAVLRAELDAYYAKLYGLTRKQLRYILDPADLTAKELKDILDPWEEVDDPLDSEGYARRVRVSDFPGETFRVLKSKEMRAYGEYRTRRLVLEAWERLNNL